MDFKLETKFTYLNNDYSALRTNPKLKHINDDSLEILFNRGFTTYENIISFLECDLSNLHDTRILKDSSKAIDIIIEAIKNGDEMVIFGDYDCDGCGATSVSVKCIRNAGGKVNFYINNRFVDGYGINKNGVNKLLEKFPNTKLIITVDNGIVAFEGISYAKSLGLKVIVTDHHEPTSDNTLPNADAVVDAKRLDEDYPFKELCGAGLAFKLMLLLYFKLGLPLDYVYSCLDIVALSTVGDIVPLVDENRIIVKEGLKLMAKHDNFIFKTFRDITGVTQLNSHYTLGYIYVPMINALGRLDGTVEKAVEMFISDDEEFIISTIKYMQNKNEERKKLTETQLATSELILEKKGLKNVIVIYDDRFHEGIIGLIAGRLKETYHRPVLVFTKHGDILKGSCRSIDNFHLKQCLDKVSQTLLGYGGHAKAAGVSIKEENLDLLEEALNNLSNELLNPDDFKKVVNVDFIINAKTITFDIMDDIRDLEPYGEGFEKPIFGIKNFTVAESYFMKNKENPPKEAHLKLKCKENEVLNILGWNCADKFKELNLPQNIKAIGFPQLNTFKDKTTLDFVIQEDFIRRAK